jgi:hypothetical protein
MLMKTLHPLIGFGLLLFAACNSNLSETMSNAANTEVTADAEWANLIDSPEIPPQQFKVNVAQGGVFVTRTGSEIHIPQGAFVDAKGNVVLGEVDILWNEYHSLSDQLLSGINMIYDSAGVSFPFISGGMFSIDGSQNGNPVFIADNKSLRIELISQSDQENFNFYSQDENGNWSFINNTTSSPQAPEQSNIISGSVAVSSPAVKRDGYIFDAQPRNLNNFDELSNREIIGWQTNKPLISRHQMKLRNEKSVCDLQQVDDEKYLLSFTFEKDSFAYPVSPYFIEDAAAETKANRAQFDSKIRETEIELADVEKQKLIRSTEISAFGTYNWDVCASMREQKPFYANFECEDPTVNLNNMTFALVCLTDNYQVRFLPGKSYSFDAAKKNTILAIDKSGSIYFVNPSSFASFRKQPMRSIDYFPLTNSGVSLTNASDLDEVIKYLKTI